MEIPTEAVHQVVIVAPGKQIATGRARQNPNAASTAEEAVGVLPAEAVVVPETRRGEGRVRRVVAKGKNVPGKSPLAGGSQGSMLLLPHAPVMTPAVSAVAVVVAVAAAASVIAHEDGRLLGGGSQGRTNLTCSDSTTAWLPHRTKTARGGVTRR